MENALLKSLALIAFAHLTTNLRLAIARGLRADPRAGERPSGRGRAKRKWVKSAINSSATKTTTLACAC